ncbi:hypothetical protein G7Y79_00026g059440 [Physcia stellaris]|nr:hypothetical protein G7Y79_00026g059440 [Physcia stellaris]
MEEVRRQVQDAHQRVTTTREQLAKVAAANGAQSLEILALDPKLEIVFSHGRKLKHYGRTQSEEELQLEQTFLEECQVLETLRHSLDIFEKEEDYKKASHDLCIARTELHLERSRWEELLEDQTRTLMELQGRIDAGEKGESLFVARALHSDLIKRTRIVSRAGVIVLKERVGFHESQSLIKIKGTSATQQAHRNLSIMPRLDSLKAEYESTYKRSCHELDEARISSHLAKLRCREEVDKMARHYYQQSLTVRNEDDKGEVDNKRKEAQFANTILYFRGYIGRLDERIFRAKADVEISKGLLEDLKEREQRNEEDVINNYY